GCRNGDDPATDADSPPVIQGLTADRPAVVHPNLIASERVKSGRGCGAAAEAEREFTDRLSDTNHRGLEIGDLNCDLTVRRGDHRSARNWTVTAGARKRK